MEDVTFVQVATETFLSVQSPSAHKLAVRNEQREVGPALDLRYTCGPPLPSPVFPKFVIPLRLPSPLHPLSLPRLGCSACAPSLLFFSLYVFPDDARDFPASKERS